MHKIKAHIAIGILMIMLALSAPLGAAAAVAGAQNGGTGSSTLTGILVGNLLGPVQSLVVGSGCTLVSLTLACPGTGSGGFPFTPQTNFSTTTSATTTAILAPVFFASSTLASQFPYASSTAHTITGTLYSPNVVSTGNLLLSGLGGSTFLQGTGSNLLTFDGTALYGGDKLLNLGILTTNSFNHLYVSYASTTAWSITSTSTGTSGINLSGGCFSINGTCISGSGGGTVTAVTATAPIFSTGGATPVISWAGLATTSQPASSNLLVSNGGAGVYAVATSSLGVTGPITFSGTIGAQVGGTGGTFGCATCLTANQSITLSGDVTGSGATAITTAFNLANGHWWTALQNFTNATTSGFEATSTNIFFSGIKNALLSTNNNGQVVATTSVGSNYVKGTPSSIFAFDGSGNAIATTSIGVNYLTGILPIANGGTATSTQVTHGVNFFDGTRITSVTNLQFDGTNLNVNNGQYISNQIGSVPTFSSLGLSNYGFGFDSSNDPYIMEGGVQALTVQASTANVGAGTTSPGSLLSVGNSGSTAGINFSLSTSTFSNVGGINLTKGCYAINGACISGGAGGGTVSSVTLASPNSTFSLSGTNPVTTSGTINADLNLGHSNWWTALQNFTNASTSQITATSSVWLTGLTASRLLALDNNGMVIASSSIGTNLLSGTLFTVTTAAPLGGAATISQGNTLALTCAGCLTSLAGAASSTLLADNNWWTGLQKFNQASTSQFTATSSIVASYLTANTLVTTDANDKLVSSSTVGWNLIKGPVSSIFAFDGSGNPIATTSIGANYISGILATANGGTGSSNLGSGAVSAASGVLSAGTLSVANGGTNTTSLPSNTLLTYNGSNIIGTSSALTINSLISTSTATSTIVGALYIGTTSNGIYGSQPATLLVDNGTSNSQEIFDMITNTNNFVEDNIQNLSTGASAQGCRTATENTGTLTTAFGSLCINNSKFWNPQAYNVGGPGDVSLMANSHDLLIAQAVAGNRTWFLNGGNSTTTNTVMGFIGNQVVVGTSTLSWGLQTLATSTAPQLALSDNVTGDNLWAFSNSAGLLSISSSTVTGTSSTAWLKVGANGTTTLENGINLSAGCVTYNGGACIGGSGSGVTGGTTGMLAAFTSATTLVATGTPTFDAFYASSTISTSTVLGAFEIGTTTGRASFVLNGTLSVGPNILQVATSTAQSIFDINKNGLVLIGTSTPGFGALTIGSANGPQTVFSDNTPGDNIWALRNFGGNFALSTSTASATSTNPALWFNAASYLWQFFSSVLVQITSATAFVVKDGYGSSVLTVNTASSSGAILTVQATSTTDTLFSVDQYGHLTASSTPARPTVSCTPSGGTISTNSNDVTGDITSGTASTACTVTFGAAYSATPEVFVQPSSGASAVGVSARSATSFTITPAAAVTADTISYWVVIP